jgi:starvation-inducible DNA-binding protein
MALPSLLTPSSLEPTVREQVCVQLNARLADTIDLAGVYKTAHWNLRGTNYFAFHAALDDFAAQATEVADRLAERITALGGIARGSSRVVARVSSLPEMKAELLFDTVFMTAVYERVVKWLAGLTSSRGACASIGDDETENLLIEIITAGQKTGWKIAATVDPAASDAAAEVAT